MDKKNANRKDGKRLIDAVMAGDTAAARALLAAGVDPNVTFNDPDEGERGLTPLMLAAEDPAQLDILGSLLSHGADPNRATRKGTTALAAAAGHGNGLAVDRLAAAGARAAGTALLGPVYRADVELVRRLLPAVDDVNAVGLRDDSFPYRSALDGAVHHRCLAFTMLSGLRAEGLFEPGDERVPRYEQQLRSHLEMIGELIRAGADVNRVNFAESPLYAAARVGDVALVRVLVTHGAIPDRAVSVLFPRRGEYRDAALHAAAGEGHVDVVAELISAGADVNKLTAAGHTPLDLAEPCGHGRIAEQLIRAGGTTAKPVPAAADTKWELNL